MVECFARDEPPTDKFRGIPGLYIKTDDGGVFATETPDPITPGEFESISLGLDAANIPYDDYWEYMHKVYDARQLAVMKNEDLVQTIRLITSSHCPIGCKFCSSTRFLAEAAGDKQKVLRLSPQQMLLLVKQAVRSHPRVTAIFFDDDDFLQDRDRALEFCALVHAEIALRGLRFLCLSRTDNVDAELLRVMSDVGFRLIIYGVESFSEQLLIDADKKVRSAHPAEQARWAVVSALSAGITPLMNLILFYPSAREADVVATVDSAVELVREGARIAVYPYVEAYPGSWLLMEAPEVKEKHFAIDGIKFRIPWVVVPKDPAVAFLGRRALQLKPRILSDIKRRCGWLGDVCNPIDSLALFLAVYDLLGRSTRSIWDAIETVVGSVTYPLADHPCGPPVSRRKLASVARGGRVLAA